MKYFLRTLKYSRLTNVSLCFSIDLPIAQSGTGDFKRAAVSSCQWPEKSLYEVQSWPSPLHHRHSPGAADTGHSLSLLTVVINLTIDRCHHFHATAMCVRCHVCCSLTPTPLMTLGRGPVGKQSYHRKINLAKQLKGTHNSFRAKRTHLVVLLIMLRLYIILCTR